MSELATKLPFTMSADEEREASLALETLSDDARFYGNSAWVTPETAPREVKNLVLKAANRHMKNYEGFSRSNAGDEGVAWSERGENPDERGSARFAPNEIDRLRDLGGNRRPEFHSVGMFAHQTRSNCRCNRHGCTGCTEGYVPTSGMSFPMFRSDESPW